MSSTSQQQDNSNSEGGITHYSLTICSSLSILSTGVLILFFIFSPKSRTFGFRLVLPLFIFDFIWSLNILIPSIYLFFHNSAFTSDSLCKIQGFIKLFSMLASFFSTAGISWTLYSFIIRKQPIMAKRMTKNFIIYIISFPLLASLIPLILDRYDHLKPLEQVMCFLVLRENSSQPTDYIGIFLRIFLYYTPFISVLLFDMVAVIRIWVYFSRNAISQHDKRDTNNLLLYPIVLFLSWIWIIVERIIEVISSDNNQSNKNNEFFWLNEIDLPLSTLNGFLNALVYGYISIDPFGFFKKSVSHDDSNSEISYLSSAAQFDANSQAISHHYLQSKNQQNKQQSQQFLNPNPLKESMISADCSLTFHIDPNHQASDLIDDS